MSEDQAKAVFYEFIGVDPEPAADEAPVISPPPIAPLVTRRRMRQPKPVLPPVEQEAIEIPAIELAYKVPFTYDANGGWSVSTDGGKSTKPSGTTSISGVPLDLALSITPATWQKGAFDWRLSLEFLNGDGIHCEINLNGLRPSKDDATQLVLTGPARALLGSLLAITDENNEDVENNIAGFMAGSRFTLKPGNVARSQYIELAICQLDPADGALTWVSFASPKYTAQVLNSPAGLIRAVEQVKQALRQRGHLSAAPAVTGRDQLPKSDEDDFTVVPIQATVIND